MSYLVVIGFIVTVLLALCIGFVIGYTSKGIDINLSNTPSFDDVPENSVNTDGIPQEMKQDIENGSVNWGMK